MDRPHSPDVAIPDQEERMSEQATGATPDQIEAAINRNSETEGVIGFYRAMANLVPPDHRIIGPEDIAALRRILGVALAAYRYDGQAMRYHMDKVEDSDFTRIDTLIGYGK
jgi:hypothetical protein